jgi:hypothetical protein
MAFSWQAHSASTPSDPVPLEVLGHVPRQYTYTSYSLWHLTAKWRTAADCQQPLVPPATCCVRHPGSWPTGAQGPTLKTIPFGTAGPAPGMLHHALRLQFTPPAVGNAYAVLHVRSCSVVQLLHVHRCSVVQLLHVHSCSVVHMRITGLSTLCMLGTTMCHSGELLAAAARPFRHTCCCPLPAGGQAASLMANGYSMRHSMGKDSVAHTALGWSAGDTCQTYCLHYKSPCLRLAGAARVVAIAQQLGKGTHPTGSTPSTTTSKVPPPRCVPHNHGPRVCSAHHCRAPACDLSVW